MRVGGSDGQTGNPAGFTLLEMLVVVAILGLAAVLVVFRGPDRSVGLDLRAAAQSAAAALREARAQAITEDTTVGVFIDAARHGYLIGAAAPRVIAAPKAVLLAGPKAGITFNPDGSSSGGTILLGIEHRTARVQVDWLTGRTRVTMAAAP